jgi:hypothetical protein
VNVGNTERAKQSLEQQMIPDWLELRSPVLRKYPGAGYWLTQSEEFELLIAETGEPDPHRAAGEPEFRASTLSEPDRRAFFKGLFPRLADHIELAWQRLATATYRVDSWQSTPFRAPNDPSKIASIRDQWLRAVIAELEGYDPDVEWLATWAGHLTDGGIDDSALILAAAIDAGDNVGERVLQILKDSASNQHDTGIMGAHIIRALLGCSRADAWEFIEKMLLAAEREEGLRQWILEAADTAHPGAFRRLLGVIAERNLTRFAATVRASDVWFGLHWDSMSGKHAHAIVEQAMCLLDSKAEREAALAGKDPETAYLALWCEATIDAHAAGLAACVLLKHPSPEHRWVGVHTLCTLNLREFREQLCESLGDENLSVAARALEFIESQWPLREDAKLSPQDLRFNAACFEQLVALLNRMPGKEVALKPLVFPWGRTKLTTKQVSASLVQLCPEASAHRLIALLGRLDADARREAALLLAGTARIRWTLLTDPKPGPLTPQARETLIAMLSDPAACVREAAGRMLAFEPPSPSEITMHESLCDRTASDTRTRALERLAAQPDAEAIASAERLLAGKPSTSRAGLDLLRALIEKGRALDAAVALATRFQSSAKKPSKEHEAALKAVLHHSPSAVGTPDDAFGLAPRVPPRPLPELRAIPHARISQAAIDVLRSLNTLVEANATMELQYRDSALEEAGEPDKPFLLGSLEYVWALLPDSATTLDRDRTRCQVHSLINEWLAANPWASSNNAHAILEAWLVLEVVGDRNLHRGRCGWEDDLKKLVKQDESYLTHHRAVLLLLAWLLRLIPSDAPEFILSQIEAAVHRRDCFRPGDTGFRAPEKGTRDLSARAWLGLYRSCPACFDAAREIDNIRRLEGILRAAVNVIATDGRPERIGDELKPTLNEVLPLWEAGDVSDAELLRHVTVVQERPQATCDSGLRELQRLFSLRLPGNRPKWETLRNSPRLDALLEKLRIRVLEVELARGDAPSPATPHALSMDPSGGIDAVVPTLANLGKLNLVRGSNYNESGKAASFSTLIRASRPGPNDSPAAFAAAAKAASLTEQRLVELALYQPRWAAHVEHTIGWKGLEEAVLWIRAHTKERKDLYRLDEDQEPWESRVAELTPISAASLGDGAVDRAWFARSYKQLGPKRWEVLYEAAKYAASGTGHVRAKLFADAMLGNLSEKELTTRVATKRHQDAARALGLIAIKSGDAGRKQVLARYKTLQEMRRTSRKHGGSALQASEKRAVEIGLENLAWTAGHPDPLRLQWAMEIEEFGDLAKGPVTAKVGDTVVTLAVDAEGIPSLTATKAGKPLKSVPPAVKKDKRVAILAERLPELRRQGSRIRAGLETAMCRADSFTGAELVTLFDHPLLKSAISRLVMVGEAQSGASFMGYPDKNGKALRSHDGKLAPLKASDSLRIAHPLDLLAAKDWHDWQKDCFRSERIQPFKQVFRELYTPTAAETKPASKQAAARTARYAGQQVQPRQALALFGSRGWVARTEEGVQRTFHHERVTVHVEFEEGFQTPAQIDGLTLAGCSFTRAGSIEPLPIKDVPPRIFSEIMRDLDLVVSVAHRGDVDPEATQSTVEMRTTLLLETCALLSLKNVRIEKQRAIIKGELAHYALHLGSGTIHKMPGGTLWVIPVHSQHRGRIFLPFADNDPKTAEIISKALMLARDTEIKDPGIIAQIRAL